MRSDISTLSIDGGTAVVSSKCNRCGATLDYDRAVLERNGEIRFMRGADDIHGRPPEAFAGECGAWSGIGRAA